MNLNENIVLENTRVLIEPLQPIHFEVLLPIALSQPNLLQYSPSPFGTLENLRKYFNRAIQAKEKGQRYPFAIYDKINQKHVGSTSYGNISVIDKRLEIGWTWIEKAAQGTRLNIYCKHLLLTYAFEQLNFERVEFKIDSRNLQSQKAVKKIGAQFEGTLRSHTLMLDGYRRDTVYYSILKGEWPLLKKGVFKELSEEGKTNQSKH